MGGWDEVPVTGDDERGEAPNRGGQERRDDNPGEPPFQRKQFEWLTISSGNVVVIDQFMLGNDQFFAALEGATGAQDRAKLTAAVGRYGGAVVTLSPGRWVVYRDPEENLMLVTKGATEEYPNRWDELIERVDVLGARGNCVAVSRVFVDTRCVVFIDADLIFNGDLMQRYRELRRAGDDKTARDVLRSNGAAVRYGFNRNGDELGLFRLADVGEAEEGSVALWPDIAEDELIDTVNID